MLVRASYTFNIFTIAIAMATIPITMPTHAISRSPFLSKVATNMADNTASSPPNFHPDINAIGLIRACRDYIQQLDNSRRSTTSFFRGEDKRVDMDTNSFDENTINNLNDEKQYNIKDNADTIFQEAITPRDIPTHNKEFLNALTQTDFLRINDIIRGRAGQFRQPFSRKSDNSMKEDLHIMNQKCLQDGLNRLLQARDEDIAPNLRKEGVDSNKLRMSLALSSGPRSTNGVLSLGPVNSENGVNSPLLTSPSSSPSSSQTGHHILRFSYKTAKRPHLKNQVKRKRAETEERTLPMTSSKRAYSAWLSIVQRVRAKRRHRLSINNAMMSLTNMLLEDNKQRTLKNRAKMRYHMYLQG